MVDFLVQVAEKLAAVMAGLVPSALAMAAVFTALSLSAAQACNPGRKWWRNPGLLTDACYWLVVPFVAPYMRMALLIVGAVFASGVVGAETIEDYLNHGRGPLAALPFWGQAAVYLILSDFLLYWSHRLFHGARLWPYHAIHHSSEEVDWTSAYRFHPVNLWLGPFLVNVLMLYLGVSPAVMLFLVPFDTVSAAFVHANLNWTLGPLKYLVATPVFHRWHHTAPEEGGERNFAPTFAFWDVLFGTFYMPDKLPQRYGVDDPAFPPGFVGQLIYPFRPERAGMRVTPAHPAVKSPAPTT
jgi:sterol desaturase/sphingolipid hydroxylase (fatty acid hydroxylase superfamily)